jgi:hypothetical protein
VKERLGKHSFKPDSIQAGVEEESMDCWE